MSENSQNLQAARRYLLGRAADEAESNRIEERLFTDREFFAAVELAEERLIEDYVDNALENEELESFRRLFLNVPERREKIRLTRALRELARWEIAERKEKKTKFSGSWIFSPQLAFGVLILTAAAAGFFGWQFVFRADNHSADQSLANLTSIYKGERLFESRTSRTDYAPLTILRGGETAKDGKKRIELRKIELDLKSAAEKDSGAANLNALGFYYLTEKRFDEAAARFEKALEINRADADLRNNLGVAFYEKSKALDSEAKSTHLEKSLEQFNQALEANPKMAEAIFNKALVLRDLNRKTDAAQVWKQYLEQDAGSKWADEARRNLP